MTMAMTEAMEKKNTDWFRRAKWGVMCHYLAAPASSAGRVEMSSEEWNRQVDSFDTEKLATQLAVVGAGYLLFTLGQNSGHYCSPNYTYDSFVGIKHSKCSRRDLVSELYNALSPKGINLMVYLPSGAPSLDPVAVKKLKWENYDEQEVRQQIVKPGRLAEFQGMWEAVIREWSERWGKKVSGWWIDGCYFAKEMYEFDEPPNFKSFAAALKSGNPDSIIAFNPGVKDPVISLTEYEDYTAGELAHNLTLGYWDSSGYNRLGQMVNGAQLQVLCFLGKFWGRGEPRFSDDLVIGYTKYINSCGGVVTWEVPISRNGQIPEAFVNQLVKLKDI